jgi:hypothetical protein
MKSILIWLGRTMIWIGRCLFILIPVLMLLIYVLFLFFYDYADNKDLGNNFTYFDEQKAIIGKVDIPMTILSYDYNKQFIIVKQKPEKYPYTASDRGIYPSGRDAIYYWLIIKAEEKVLGPLDFEEFKELRKKYGVPNELVLE